MDRLRRRADMEDLRRDRGSSSSRVPDPLVNGRMSKRWTPARPGGGSGKKDSSAPSKNGPNQIPHGPRTVKKNKTVRCESFDPGGGWTKCGGPGRIARMHFDRPPRTRFCLR